ncbi:MAG TPA: hypothetical protein VMW51_11115 [Terriglobia bacterium]|nr:hypothetical protein [Terriglobia bacterium]
MAPSTKFREPTPLHPRNRGAAPAKPVFWPRLRLILRRAIFWSYERGSWQYDIIVLVILAFIFLTPSRWFHDRPHLQLSDLRHVQGIVEVGHSGDTWVYELDARLVDSIEGVQPQQAVHQLLLNRVNPPFVIKSLKPILGKGDVILGYTVEVRR